ncbi:glycogen-binding subunit 76A isoform X2 [Leptidea sinapis]|uniref:glycogen-binding subunit 76A isoform X2 n=1 Tax=Leptidea sinapis TaxID=189913 RepID=UPI00212133D6|nr:glycogen-binding subunit 76A isoform X2 [Leptidea sinapis]
MDLRTQMSGDRAGSQCGLSSLLPMSCRGRAAAFARDLHSRLRNLGATQDGDCENSWLTQENGTHKPSTSTQRDLDTFYDFELECESPSSPVDEYIPPFQERLPNESEPRYYDIDQNDPKEQTKFKLRHPDNGKNGFLFSTAFYTESPIKLQPVPKENGHNDKPMFTPITFEGCARHNSFDEVDCIIRPSQLENERVTLEPLCYTTIIDSDSEFESAKEEPSQEEDLQNGQLLNNDLNEMVEKISLNDVEDIVEDENIIETVTATDINIITNAKTEKEEIDASISTEIVKSESSLETELPQPEIETTILAPKEEEDIEDDRPQRVRRCSSLKTGKTPPGTPGRKKIVRFADVLGLDLADVKTFMDEIPVIPKSAYDDLAGSDVQNSPPTRPSQRLGALTLVPLFQLPHDVTDKLERHHVCLESARVCDGVHVTVCGSVRVRNLDFHKTVHIRYTMNRWKTYTDLQATYVQGSCDGYSDRFQFLLYVPCISSGQRLEIAVRFQCKGQQLWDNNCGANYCFDCLALGASLTPPSPLHPTIDWHPSFY